MLVIGTVKKIDDLRRTCKAYLRDAEEDLKIKVTQTGASCSLRFAMCWHDEYARQMWLDTYTVAKVIHRDGAYIGLGDPAQTKCVSETAAWSDGAVDGVSEQRAYEASLHIQTDMWSELRTWLKACTKRDDWTTVKNAMVVEELMTNHRSHPTITRICSKAFYNDAMQVATDFTDRDFPLKALTHRIIFVDTKSEVEENKASTIFGKRNNVSDALNGSYRKISND